MEVFGVGGDCWVDVDGGLVGVELDALGEELLSVGVVGEFFGFRGVGFWFWDMCDEESPGEADLRGGEADARCVLHGVDHAVGDFGDEGGGGGFLVFVWGGGGGGAGGGGGVRVVEDAEGVWPGGLEVGCGEG